MHPTIVCCHDPESEQSCRRRPSDRSWWCNGQRTGTTRCSCATESGQGLVASVFTLSGSPARTPSCGTPGAGIPQRQPEYGWGQSSPALRGMEALWNRATRARILRSGLLHPSPDRLSMRDGFPIYDADTHVHPCCEVLDRYVDPDFRPLLDELAQFRGPFADGLGNTPAIRISIGVSEPDPIGASPGAGPNARHLCHRAVSLNLAGPGASTARRLRRSFQAAVLLWPRWIAGEGSTSTLHDSGPPDQRRRLRDKGWPWRSAWCGPFTVIKRTIAARPRPA